MTHSIDYYQVRANSLIIYERPVKPNHRRYSFDDDKAQTYSGKVTPHARRRLLKALDILVQKSPERRVYSRIERRMVDFKLNFTTLTIADQTNISVKEAYDNLLSKWVRYMRDRCGMKEYVWKAEYQKRGQVHYHVASNVFMEWQTIKWKWNQLQKQGGYLEGFAKKFGHFNPPSTDIHRMENVQDCLTYIAKEMCKDVQNQKTTQGKIWDCSKGLKIDRFADVMTPTMGGLIDDAIQHGFAEEVKSDHCTIIKSLDPTAFLSDSERKRYFSHIK